MDHSDMSGDMDTGGMDHSENTSHGVMSCSFSLFC